MPKAVYKCNLCGFEHEHEITGSQVPWTDEYATNFVSRVVKLSDTHPNLAAGMLPKYFVCNCKPGQRGTAEFVGVRY